MMVRVRLQCRSDLLLLLGVSGHARVLWDIFNFLRFFSDSVGVNVEVFNVSLGYSFFPCRHYLFLSKQNLGEVVH